jgi:ABC-type antimicrobial peptide transport system permease subunit
MALGARYGQVLRMVLQRSLLWVAGGLAIGAALALLARPVTGQLVAGISASDPLTYCAVLGIFASIVVAASIIPARRASRVNPVEALRHE